MIRLPLRQFAFPFGMILILALIVIKNQLDKKYVRDLGASMATVIEDRLLVEGYIYDLSNQLHHKHHLISSCEDAGTPITREHLLRSDTIIRDVLADYARTRLTEAESLHFDHLQETLARIIALEQAMMVQPAEERRMALLPDLERRYRQAGEDLDRLSAIQLEEGLSQHAHSRRIVAGSSLLSQVEIILLIALGMMLQGLLRRFRTVPAKLIRRPEWN